MKNCILTIITFCLISCTKKAAPYTEKLGGQEFIVKDSTSTIIIGHCDITECLDAELLSGQLYFPEKVFHQIKNKYLVNGLAPYQHDLYLTGKNNITYKLFDSILNPKMGNKYLVKGKVVGYRGYGVVFKIDSHKLLTETAPGAYAKGKKLADVFPVENIESVKITNIHGEHLLTAKELFELKEQFRTAAYSGGLLEKPGHIFLEIKLRNSDNRNLGYVYASKQYIHFDKGVGTNKAEFTGSFQLPKAFDFDKYE